MKKLTKYFLSVILCLSLFLASTNITLASEKSHSIENNTIKILAYKYPYDIQQSWVEFKFVDQGNGTAKLKAYSNGEFIDYNNFHPKLALYEDLRIELTNIYGYVGESEFIRGYSMKIVAQYLESLTFTYGVDTIKIRKPDGVWNPDFGSEGSPVFKYGGWIHSNLGNVDFDIYFSFGKNTKNYRFRIREDGLYAEVINQNKINDGNYIIKPAGNSSKTLDISSGNNIIVSDYNFSESQVFALEYDDLRKAYKIKKSSDKSNVLHWDRNNGANVIASTDRNSDAYGEQFWYLYDKGNGEYEIASARTVLSTTERKVLNLDANGTNISVANTKNNIKQRFKFIEVEIGGNQPLQNGTYNIRSDHNEAYIGRGSSSQFANVFMNPASVSYPSISKYPELVEWVLEYNESINAYRIKSKNHQDCSLEWNPGIGSHIMTWGNSNLPGQYWRLVPVNSSDRNKYKLVSVLDPSKVLQYNTSADQFMNLQAMDDSNSSYQHFYFVEK